MMKTIRTANSRPPQTVKSILVWRANTVRARVTAAVIPSDQDGVNIVVAGDGPQHEALAEGEDPEEDEVDWKLPPDIRTAGERDDADERDSKAGVVEPDALTTDIAFQRVNKQEAGNDGASEEELHHEDTVDLPHEVPPDGFVREPFQVHLSGGFRVILASRGSRGGEMSRIWRRWRQRLDTGVDLFISHLTETLLPCLALTFTYLYSV